MYLIISALILHDIHSYFTEEYTILAGASSSKTSHICSPTCTLNIPSRIPPSENGNSELRKCKFHAKNSNYELKNRNSVARKCKFCTQKLNCALRKCKFHAKKFKIMPSEM